MITFLLPVFDEPDFLVQLRIEQLLSFHKNSKVLVLVDGLERITFKHCLQYKNKERLKVYNHRALWLGSYLQLLVDSDSSGPFVKIDPDCEILAGVQESSLLGDFFGGVTYSILPKFKERTLKFPGGARGFSLTGVQQLLKVGFFDDIAWSNFPYAGREDTVIERLLTAHGYTAINNEAFSFRKDITEKTCFWHR